MYVCVCLGVTESSVEEAIVGGAATREDVTRACGAGGDCGACHGMIATMIEDHAEAMATCSGACPTAMESGEHLVSDGRLVPDDALVRRRGRAA